MPDEAEVKELEVILASGLYQDLAFKVKAYSPAVVLCAITGTLYRVAEASNKTIDEVLSDLKELTPLLGDPEDGVKN